MRGRGLILALCLAGCSSAPSELEKRNQALLVQHDEIWNLMGLSPRAKDELNALVLAVNTRMYHNKTEHPQEYQAASAVKRSPPKTREEYLAAHKKRFDALKISEPTQKELLASADFVWTALQPDARVSPEKRKTAETIRDMMAALKGPPPCCDDNIFERAARK